MPRNTGMLVAREPVVVIVGAKAAVYDTITVPHNKTGQMVTMNKDQPREEAVEGIPYAFKQYQRVARNHPAVKVSPGSFIPIEELADDEQDLVKT